MDRLWGKARAKVNLTLDIIARRQDGYHDIASVMHTIGLADEVGVALSGGRSVTLRVKGAELPEDSRNLAWRAAAAVLAAAGGKRPGEETGLDIELVKKVPFEAGLAGGSSDAATTLQLANMALGNPLDDGELLAIAANLGSDVPFLMNGGAAYASKAGNELTFLEMGEDLPTVIAKPHAGLSTSLMYRAWDEKNPEGAETRPSGGNSTERFIESLNRHGTVEALRHLHNDFEELAAIAVPEVLDLKAQMMKKGAISALMSGSGTAVYGIFEEEATAMEAEEAIRAGYRGVFTAVTRLDPRRGIPMLRRGEQK